MSVNTSNVTALSPFTNSVATEIWGYKDNKPVFVCPDTGALFFDRAMLENNTYQGYYPYLDGFDDDRFTWEYSIRKKNYTKQLTDMRRLAPGPVLVDIGAGPGYLCRAASETGWTAYGIELSKQAVRYGKQKFGVVYREYDDFLDKSIDVVVCHHVFEHLIDPMSFLEKTLKKLNTNGLLVVHVPHQQPLSFLMKAGIRRLFRRKSDSHCALYGNEHVSGFTMKSLQAVVESAGYGTHFVKSADLWTKYYDPFFLRSYIQQHNYAGMTKSFIRHSIDSVGIPSGCGDWIIGYFFNPFKKK
jgi:SAM-dependent methyltransferase